MLPNAMFPNAMFPNAMFPNAMFPNVMFPYIMFPNNMSRTISFTFIRHGESTDNLTRKWAGWRDSELSNHGKAQAEALGKSFENTPFTAIVSSSLKRALTTAEVLQKAQKTTPPLTVSPLLREQSFGLGEGKPSVRHRNSGLSFQALVAKGIYPWTFVRYHKFPEGESLDDVAKRADQAVEQFIIPYVKMALEHDEDLHVAIVSHGVAISELIASLERRGGYRPRNYYRGLRNTGWTLVTVEVERGQRAEGLDIGCVPLRVRVLQHNSCDHLNGLVRQGDGIGSSAYDPKQTDVRSFFKSEASTSLKPS